MTDAEAVSLGMEISMFVLNLALAAGLFCVAGLVAAKLLGRRELPVQYWLLFATVVVLIAAPPSLWCAQRLGLGLFRISAETSPQGRVDAARAPRPASLARAGNGMPAEDPIPYPSTLDGEGSEYVVNVGSAPSAGGGGLRNLGDSAGRFLPLVGFMVAALWVVGALVRVVGFGRGLVVVGRLRGTLERPSGGVLRSLAAQTARKVGLRVTPAVYTSRRVAMPLSAGFFRPYIVLPHSIELERDQLEAVLLHECGHIAQRDHLAGLAQAVVTAFYWWNPLVYVLNRELSELRERICDNHVIKNEVSGKRYAHTLVELAARAHLVPALPHSFGIIDPGTRGLEGRVRRLLDGTSNTKTALGVRSGSGVVAFGLALCALLLFASVHATATTTATALDPVVKVSDREALIRAVADAVPGTTIQIAPGEYRGGLRFGKLEGTAGKPIIIAAADPKDPPTIRGGTSGMQLTDPAHVELRNIVFAGARANGLNIDDGGSFATPAKHIVLRGLEVRDVGPKGNRDGIKLSGVVDFRVEDCALERWGDGGSGIDMVGCHRGLISGCTFRHEGVVGANGVQTKGGSRDIAIRRCRFENAGGRSINVGGSTELPYFRPRPEGFEAKDITVEDNTFIGSMAPIAFVGVDGATVRFNTLYRPGRWVVRILQESTGKEFVPSRNGRFTNNIVAYSSKELSTVVNIGSGTAPKTFEFKENFWFCIDRPEKSGKVKGMLPVPEEGGTYGKDPLFVAPERGKLELKAGSPARGAGPRAARGGDASGARSGG